MLAVSVLLGLSAAALAVPTTVFLIEVLFAIPAHRPRPPHDARRPRVAVLVPAHNEALGIAATVQGLRAHVLPGDRLLVVADNCNDDTVKLARAAGAEVVERTDPIRRGKGFAVDHGIRYLAADPPDVVVIVDADTDVDPLAIDRIARLCSETCRPVQAVYQMRVPSEAGMHQRVAAFAWRVKNCVRPLGAHRIGLPCQLTGTGTAFPWRGILSACTATGHITEDMLLGIELAHAGTPPLLHPDARVTSSFAPTAIGAHSQRRRWEHGHIGLVLSHAPKLFMQGLRCGDLRLAGMALDLAVPPLALLTLMLAAVAFAALALAMAEVAVLPLWIALAALGMLLGGVVLAWVHHGRQVISLWQLAYAPLYALRKLPLYLGFAAKRQTEWVRTPRHD
jgi:cellulose synthase/poly-beta-1,6-N-acetylglucosamine synthase-like glycosyltransferase